MPIVTSDSNVRLAKTSLEGGFLAREKSSHEQGDLGRLFLLLGGLITLQQKKPSDKGLGFKDALREVSK